MRQIATIKAAAAIATTNQSTNSQHIVYRILRIIKTGAHANTQKHKSSMEKLQNQSVKE